MINYNKICKEGTSLVDNLLTLWHPGGFQDFRKKTFKPEKKLFEKKLLNQKH